MVNVELGTFLAFLAVPTIALIFMGKIRSWGITGYILFVGLGVLAFIMIGGLSLMMYLDYDVVMTENVAIADAGGSPTGSETHVNPIITSFQDIWALIFGAFAVVFGLIYFKVMLTGAP